MTRFYDENREAFLVPETIESLVRLAAYEQDPSVQECSLRALTNLALCCMALTTPTAIRDGIRLLMNVVVRTCV